MDRSPNVAAAMDGRERPSREQLQKSVRIAAR